jgi:hypothetical protein
MKTNNGTLTKTDFFAILFIVIISAFGIFYGKSERMDNNTTYYINNQKDFENYKNDTFPAGAKILFAAGRNFNGRFAPKGKGTQNNPIVMTSYNPQSGKIYRDNTNNKAIINGHGKVNAPVFLHNTEYWEIQNLEVTNTDGTKKDQGDLMGIYVVTKNMGIAEHVVIKNCYVHDVNGDVAGKRRGGIHVHVKGKKRKTKFHDLLIAGNLIEDVGGVGIGNDSSWPDIGEEGFYPWTDVVLRGNRVAKTGRNGIIIRYSYKPLVEYNVLAHNGQFSHGHSIFNFNTVDCKMQYNEAYGNRGKMGEIDRGGFDADWNSRGTVIQYNYSHDNHWFCGIMRRYNRDITIRYNISQNERMGVYYYGFSGAYNIRDVKIYNNTHYFRDGLDATIFISEEEERTPIQTAFYNNIFYFEDSARIGIKPDETCEFSHNLFYNLKPHGRHAITKDPLFINPGKGGTEINMKDSTRLSGYRLQKNSPAIEAGLFVSDNGEMDFWNNSLYEGSPEIGAYEYSDKQD